MLSNFVCLVGLRPVKFLFVVFILMYEINTFASPMLDTRPSKKIQLFLFRPDLAETQVAMCCASVTTTLRSRMTLNALCPLSTLSYTESTTIRAGSMTLPWWGSKAQPATVWHSILTQILCACLRWVTSGRRGLLPV